MQCLIFMYHQSWSFLHFLYKIKNIYSQQPQLLKTWKYFPQVMIVLTFHQFTELNNYNFALIIIGLAKLHFASTHLHWWTWNILWGPKVGEKIVGITANMMKLSNFSLKYLPKLTLMWPDRNQLIANHSFAIRKLDICVRTSL